MLYKVILGAIRSTISLCSYTLGKPGLRLPARICSGRGTVPDYLGQSATFKTPKNLELVPTQRIKVTQELGMAL